MSKLHLSTCTAEDDLAQEAAIRINEDVTTAQSYNAVLSHDTPADTPVDNTLCQHQYRTHVCT